MEKHIDQIEKQSCLNAKMKTIKRFLKVAGIMILFVVFITSLFASENRSYSNNKAGQILLSNNVLLNDNPSSSENRTEINLGKFQFAFMYQGDYIEEYLDGQIWKIRDFGPNDLRGFGDNDIFCVDDKCPNDELMDSGERREHGFAFSLIKYDSYEGRKEKGVFRVDASFSEDFQMLQSIQIHFVQNELYKKGEKVTYSIWAKDIPRVESPFYNTMDFRYKEGVSSIESATFNWNSEYLKNRSTKAINSIGFNVSVMEKSK